MNLFYTLIYNPVINYILRNINLWIKSILPKKIRLHPSGIVKIKIAPGKNIVLKTNQTCFITSTIFYNKNKFEYAAIFMVLISKVNVFFDIGANIGYYSVLGGVINTKLKIYAFEPATGASIYCAENIRLNNIEKKVNLFKLALSDKKGEIDFYEIINKKFPTIYNLSGEHNIGTKMYLESKRVKVASDTLDDFCFTNNIKEIDLIKIDTEGCEDAILNWGFNIINQCKPIVICEMLFNKIELSLEVFFKKLNYTFYIHYDDALHKVESIQRENDNGVRNCFFVHPSKIHLIEEFIR